jgi:hypothetical protein
MNSWIESHQSLAGHAKTRRAARLLKVSRPAIVGHLHFLWWWAIDAAPSGDLTAFEPEDIAEEAGWDGDANEFVDALINCRTDGEDSKGFLERTEEGKLLIHDWNDYAGKLVDKRNRDRDRKQKSRASFKVVDGHTQDCDTAKDVRVTSVGHPRDVHPCHADVHALQDRTGQDRTEQNIEGETQAEVEAKPTLPTLPSKSEDVTPEMIKAYERVVPPPKVIVAAHAVARHWPLGEAKKFYSHHEMKGWIPGNSKTKMKSWKAAMITWETSDFFPKSAAVAPSKDDDAVFGASPASNCVVPGFPEITAEVMERLQQRSAELTRQLTEESRAMLATHPMTPEQRSRLEHLTRRPQ